MLLRTLVKKELLNNIVSFRFTLIFLLCCTLIIVSAYTMRGKYDDRVKEYSTAVNIHKQELEESQGEGQGIHRIAVGGYKLDKPPTPLSAIVEGMEGAAGKFTTVNILPLSTPMLEGGTGDEPMFIYFGTLDMMYIVRAVLSLVAILLTYDAISGERERDANQDVTEGPEDNMILIDQGMSDDIKRSRDEIQAEYERKREAQFRLAAGISRISPASVYTYAAIGLAGTGLDRQRRFLEAARAYQVGFREYFEGILNRAMRGGGSPDDARFDVNRLPTFRFRDLTLSESWNDVKIDALMLFMLLVCLFMVSYVSFIRGDLR